MNRRLFSNIREKKQLTYDANFRYLIHPPTHPPTHPPRRLFSNNREEKQLTYDANFRYLTHPPIYEKERDNQLNPPTHQNNQSTHLPTHPPFSLYINPQVAPIRSLRRRMVFSADRCLARKRPASALCLP